jgi:hypothetical protein
MSNCQPEVWHNTYWRLGAALGSRLPGRVRILQRLSKRNIQALAVQQLALKGSQRIRSVHLAGKLCKPKEPAGACGGEGVRVDRTGAEAGATKMKLEARRKRWYW